MAGVAITLHFFQRREKVNFWLRIRERNRESGGVVNDLKHRAFDFLQIGDESRRDSWLAGFPAALNIRMRTWEHVRSAPSFTKPMVPLMYLRRMDFPVSTSPEIMHPTASRRSARRNPSLCWRFVLTVSLKLLESGRLPPSCASCIPARALVQYRCRSAGASCFRRPADHVPLRPYRSKCG